MNFTSSIILSFLLIENKEKNIRKKCDFFHKFSLFFLYAVALIKTAAYFHP